MEKVTCGIIQDLLISYCDGLTEENVAQMIQEHLAECPNCQQRHKEIQEQREIEADEELSRGKSFGDKLKGIRYYAIGIGIGILLPPAAIFVFYIIGSIKSYVEFYIYSYFF